MIESVEGNLLEAKVQTVVNAVNTGGVMGKGIALQFKKAYPEMFKAYEQACAEGAVQLGRMHVFDRGGLFNPRFIINFPTKKHWKARSKITDIQAGLEDLVRLVKELGIESIAIPPLGCGLGGLNWGDVEPLIQKAFQEMADVRVLIYQPSGAPAPERIANRTKRFQ